MAPRSYEKVGQGLPEDVVALVGTLEIETPLSDAEQKAVLRKVALRILPIWCAPRVAPRARAAARARRARAGPYLPARAFASTHTDPAQLVYGAAGLPGQSQPVSGQAADGLRLE